MVSRKRQGVVDYFSSVTVTGGKYGFVTGTCKVAEGGYWAGHEGGRIIDHGANRFQRDHAIAGIEEPLSIVLDRKNRGLQILSICLDYGRLLARFSRNYGSY